MSVIDKVVAAITPPETDEMRMRARETARECASRAEWLALILEHHLGLEAAFDRVKSATDAASRSAALRELGVLFTGHAIAEEAVIYPAMTEAGQTGKSGMGYQEQATVKVQMAALEALEPMSQDFDDKLEHIRGAVLHHLYQEEGTWFPKVVEEATPAEQERIYQRYTEEYDRYMGGGEGRGAMSF